MKKRRENRKEEKGKKRREEKKKRKSKEKKRTYVVSSPGWEREVGALGEAIFLIEVEIARLRDLK